MMDERWTSGRDGHLDEERIGLAVDGLQPLCEADRRHLEKCAVCRREVERQQAVAALVAELGERYRLQAPPNWPAASAIIALAQSVEQKAGWLDRLASLLPARLGLVAAGLAGVLVVGLLAVAVLVAVRPPAEPPAGGGVAATPADAGLLVALRPGPSDAGPAQPDVGRLTVDAPLAVPSGPTRQARSSLVAVAAGRDVSYVVMNVLYEGGTATVLWVSALPATVSRAIL